MTNVLPDLFFCPLCGTHYQRDAEHKCRLREKDNQVCVLIGVVDTKIYIDGIRIQNVQEYKIDYGYDQKGQVMVSIKFATTDAYIKYDSGERDEI